MNELAIASVTPQQWETPSDETKALKEGSIFPSLNKPFYIEEEMPKDISEPASPCEKKLLDIQRATFFLIDLTLFLDTHPDDAEAKNLASAYRQKRKQLLAEFAAEYYPLTMDCEGDCKEEAVPWEGVKSDVAL